MANKKNRPLWSGLKNLPPLPKHLPKDLFWSRKEGDPVTLVDEVNDDVKEKEDPKEA
jgi:hypothetical protein